MKTVSGTVVSSKPISLSKAAKILSQFAIADNGASPAFVYYLKRASDSFDELVHLHKELRASGSDRKRKKHRSGTGIRDEAVEEPVNSVGNYGEGKKKKKKKEEEEEEDNGVEQSTQGISETVDNNNNNSLDGKKRKKVNGVVGILKVASQAGGNGELVEIDVISNKKMDINNGSQAENRESRKRKSEEMAAGNGSVNDSAEKKMVQNKKRKQG